MDRSLNTFDVEELQCVIEDLYDKWDERSMFKIGDVTNLSQSDLSVLEMCCRMYSYYGTLDMLYLSPEVKAVLKNFGYIFGEENHYVYEFY